MNPYPILAGLLLVIAAAFSGEHVGRKLERTTWQAKEIATAAATQKDLIAEHDKYVALQTSNEATARKATADHVQAINRLSSDYAAARAAIRAAGGLRISRTVCADPHATAAESASASGLDGAGAGTVELPERTQADLLQLTERADKLAERLRGLQAWVKASGHYGDAP